jgi:hypothetical protein
VPQLPIEAPLFSRFFLAVAFFHAISNACLKRPPKVGGNSIRKKEERLSDFRTMRGVNNAQNGTVRQEQIDFIRSAGDTFATRFPAVRKRPDVACVALFVVRVAAPLGPMSHVLLSQRHF